MAPVLLREGGTPKDSIKAAQGTVKADPATWQKGRDRARRLLEQVRKGLVTREQGHVRASIVDQTEAASLERLSHPDVAVPNEIKILLETMVANA